LALLLNAKVSDRVIVLNDPVNMIDPYGLTMQYVMFAVDFAEGFTMPTTMPPTPGGIAGHLARDRFDNYVDLDDVAGFISDSWGDWLDEARRNNWAYRSKNKTTDLTKPREYSYEQPCE
jgi:hypothetical protein